MAGTNKQRGDHSFVGDSNVTSGNEFGSRNFTVFNFDNSAGLVLVVFFVVCAIAVIVYMSVQHGSLFTFLISASVICVLVVGVVYIIVHLGTKTFLTISGAKSQHAINENNKHWSKYVYQLPSGQVASLNPVTRELQVHTSRDVQEVHHHNPVAQIGTGQAVDGDSMPSMYDLTYTDED